MPSLRRSSAAAARRLAAARCSSIFGKQIPVENHTSSTPARYFANCSRVAFHTSGLSVWGFRSLIAENGIVSATSELTTLNIATHTICFIFCTALLFHDNFTKPRTPLQAV